MIEKKIYHAPWAEIIYVQSSHLLRDFSTKDGEFHGDGADFGDQDPYTDSDEFGAEGIDFGSGI